MMQPVNKATLRGFLEHAAARHLVTQPANIESLRADRDEILQCLLHANLKLQEYDQDRTNFLARAVHDFRAPLTAIDGYCGLILGQQLGPITEEQQEVLERMQHSIMVRGCKPARRSWCMAHPAAWGWRRYNWRTRAAPAS